MQAILVYCPVAMVKHCDKINLRDKLIWFTIPIILCHGREITAEKAGKNWSSVSHSLSRGANNWCWMLEFSLPSPFHTAEPTAQAMLPPTWSWVFHISEFTQDKASQTFSEANLSVDRSSWVFSGTFSYVWSWQV